MRRGAQNIFLCLILAQAAHSAEECYTRLYEVFAPARLVTRLFSAGPAVGFLIGNVLLVLFGLWCWAFPVRRMWPGARHFAWFWICIELGNGLVHTAMALGRGGYFPGVATAPLLLLCAGWLARELSRT